MKIEPYLFFEGRTEEALAVLPAEAGREGRSDHPLQGKPGAEVQPAELRTRR